MRKRIVIGLLAVVVIGTAVFFFSQPKKGSVEWHMQQRVKGWNRLNGETWPERSKRIIFDITGHALQPQRLSADEWHRISREAESNWVALVNAGYLREKRFVLTNTTFEALYRSASPLERYPVHDPFVKVWPVKRDAGEEIVLTAPPEVIREWETVVRKLEAPQAP